MLEPAEEVLILQRCLVSLALDPETTAFEAAPGAFAARQGLSARDQEAFQRSRSRMLFYRFGVRSAIWEPMEAYLPLTQAVLRPTGAWEECASAFLAARALASPFHRDIAPTFLGWLDTTGWGRERWPFLLEMVHFELVRELVEHLPDPEVPAGLHAAPSLEDRLVLAPSTQVLSYAHAMHEATLEHPVPQARPCNLLANRGPDGLIQWRELSGATAAFLVRAQAEPIEAAARALGEEGSGFLPFLAVLQDEGAILGFLAWSASPRNPGAQRHAQRPIN